MAKRAGRQDINSPIWRMIALLDGTLNGNADTQYVYGVCLRAGEKLSLTDVVRVVLKERPDLRLTFARIWADLIRDRRIAFVHDGKGRHYMAVKSTTREHLI
jgi:hypothetical protein